MNCRLSIVNPCLISVIFLQTIKGDMFTCLLNFFDLLADLHKLIALVQFIPNLYTFCNWFQFVGEKENSVLLSLSPESQEIFFSRILIDTCSLF